MSYFKAKIVEIENEESLHIVKFSCDKYQLSMMSLDLYKNAKIGCEVILHIKPTSIALAKDIQGNLSYSNQLACTIESIDDGKLLSGITLNMQIFKLESLITYSSRQKMQLKVGDSVIALIKANELSISGFLDV